MVGGAAFGDNAGRCPVCYTDGLADKWLVELLSVITWDIALCVTHMV